MGQTNVEKLQSANILRNPHGLSPEDENKVNSLKPEEVDALCRVKAQLGEDFVERNSTLIL